MSMLDWAKKEVEIACKKEGECGYGCACYESALKAFNCLMEDGHSGMSIGFTKNILNRLIDGKCLTPIEDTDDVWGLSSTTDAGVKIHQCKRMSSFFKDIYPDGTVKYTDCNRTVKVDINTGTTWHNGDVRGIIDEMYPIKMPYMPCDNRYRVYCEDFLTDPKNGDYDTIGVLYGINPDGDRFEINRYFKETDTGMKEIDKNEYEDRKRKSSASLHLTHNDDKKEKSQSHTISVFNNDSLFNCSIDSMIGCGETKEEAYKDFLDKFDKCMDELRRFEKEIHNNPSFIEVDCMGKPLE